MKAKEKNIKLILRWLASKILQKYKPVVIGITGSVGKSTTKEMVYTVLNDSFEARKSEKNYNNEIGIPLAIIGVTGEKKSLYQWLNALLRAMMLILFPWRYPKILVLELAADKKGDIKYFCDFIDIDIGILTNVGISHLENFKTKEAIFREKSYLLKQAKEVAIYNKDGVSDDDIEKLSLDKVISYGLQREDVDLRIVNEGYHYNKNSIVGGMIFKVETTEKVIPGRLKNVFGRPYLYGFLAALSVAQHFNINILVAMQRLEDFPAIPGHMSLLKGIKNSIIIDDTYNSAPASLMEALKVMKDIEASRKIVILGDMLELGSEEDEAHRMAGNKVSEIEGVIFIAVGTNMKLAKEEFLLRCKEKEGESECVKRVYWFTDSVKAGVFVQRIMKQKDVLLVKGSQGLRMEKVVEEVMAEPNRKKELLVRQNKDWK